jgi:hypothetical protein
MFLVADVVDGFCLFVSSKSIQLNLFINEEKNFNKLFITAQTSSKLLLIRFHEARRQIFSCFARLNIKICSAMFTIRATDN